MTNWFQTHNINPIYGWGPSKRWIVLGGPAAPDPSSSGENDAFAEQMRALVDKARKAGCVYVEIRCFEDYSAYRPALEAAGFVYEPHYDVIFDLREDPLRMMKVSKRQQLKQAIQNGEKWRETTCEDVIHAWYERLLHLYRTKIHRPLPNEKWFREMIIDKGCRLLVVESQQQIIGGVLLAVEDDKSKAYEWYKCGPVMSTWAAIEWCRQNDIRCLDTMGAGMPGVPYGVRDFKLEMGGELKEYGRYRSVLKPWLYRLGEWVMRSRK